LIITFDRETSRAQFRFNSKQVLFYNLPQSLLSILPSNTVFPKDFTGTNPAAAGGAQGQAEVEQSAKEVPTGPPE